MSGSFDDLLQRAEQLTADMDTGHDLPRVERNLPQLAEAGQRLWAKTATLQAEGADVRAYVVIVSYCFAMIYHEFFIVWVEF